MRLRLFLPLFLALSLPLAAQSPTPQNEEAIQTRIALWRCITDGGNYAVVLAQMVSVSIHSYQVDNVARVTEVNVDTIGNAMVRFYYLEPIEPESPAHIGQATLNKIREITEEAVDRTGQAGMLTGVIKSYPTTTHARTIEYRVNSREDLQRIFNSADTALRTRRPSTVRVGKPQD